MFISCYVFLQVYLSLLISCSAIDVITINSASLSDEKGETLVSAGKIFELGFFTPDGNSDGQRYVGIWYYGLSGKTPIWVANRDEPLSDSRDGVLGIDDGNLKIKDGSGIVYWSTNLKPTQYRGVAPRVSTPGAWEAKLSDSGNLIVSDRQGQSVWQSFQNPTDTFLPGMKMDEDLSLTSWKSQDDPGKGNFTFKQEREHQVSINKSDNGLYWKSDLFHMEKISTKIGCLLSNFSKTRSQNCSLPELDYNNTRMVMNSSGEIQLWNLAKDRKEWLLKWLEPRDKCSVVKACGNFGICNSNNQLTCDCLPGYKPKFPQEWNQKKFWGGCIRMSEVFCQNDTFLNLTDIRVATTDIAHDAESETDCKNICLGTCQNQAYSYTGEKRKRDDLKNCFIWTDNMNNLQDYPVVGCGGGVPVTAVRLSVRVTPSDIGLTARSCDPCGKNVIPYPLSSESSCGDPMYSSFPCDKSTGKISFKSQNSTYDVKNINSSSRSFVILLGASDNCTARPANADIILLNQSLPFTLLNVSGNYISSVLPPKRMNEIEISWKPPPEPTCGGPADCMDWPYSACNVTGNGTGRCICNKNYRWDPDNLNCTHVEETSPIVQTVPPSRGASGGEIRVSIAVGATIAGIIVISSTIVFIYISRRKKDRRRESEENINRTAELRYGTEKRLKDLISSEEFKEEDKKGIDVPFFEFESIVAATDNFSDANKLGRGGFGPVYKGTFPGGREMAIKRLSNVSGQGLEEFKNEVVLIAKLQHRNLVRLLGYCIKGDEKLLIYEYMRNRSLDFFIFEHGMVLNWEARFNIILGVARGLLYLHQDSRLRIIHRDLKTGNILLDDEMNPKISDFGLARIFEGKQTEGTTNRVIGTYGYMSPEYALDGLFSVKSDAFSFGVVLLEILSGKRNAGYFQAMHNMSLLGYAWRLWTEGLALDLMDEMVRESCDRSEFLKCVNVALLCVQDDPADRPTMSNVVVMLSGETTTLPTPKQPAFVVTRDVSETTSSSKQEIVTSCGDQALQEKA